MVGCQGLDAANTSITKGFHPTLHTPCTHPFGNAAEAAAVTGPDPTGNRCHPRDRPIPGYPQQPLPLRMADAGPAMCPLESLPLRPARPHDERQAGSARIGLRQGGSLARGRPPVAFRCPPPAQGCHLAPTRNPEPSTSYIWFGRSVQDRRAAQVYSRDCGGELGGQEPGHSSILPPRPRRRPFPGGCAAPPTPPLYGRVQHGVPAGRQQPR
jgi:hypothetical protein